MATKKTNESEVLDPEVVDDTPTGLIRYEQPARELALTPVFDVAEAKKRLEKLQVFVREYLVEGEDYGTIPGTPKPTLYKSGADKLCDIYGMADKFHITSRTEDWSQGLFDYEVECTLISKRTGQVVGSGLGSCSSFESKYRYREQKRQCPKCGQEAIIKGREEFGGGWICWKKEGKSNGCGAKFVAGDALIVNQAVGRIQNEDIADQKNTILKMALKRSKVGAVLGATRSSSLFTQDIEDWPRSEVAVEPLPQAAAAPKPEPPKPAPKPVTPAAKPVGPPKANIPVNTTTKPPVPKETPRQAPIAEVEYVDPGPSKCPECGSSFGVHLVKCSKFKKPDAPKVVAKPPKSRQERARDACAKIGCSTTNLTSFICRTLGVAPEEVKKVHVNRIEAVVWALEQSINKFATQEGLNLVGNLVRDEEIDSSVKSYFTMAFAKAEKT